MTKPRKSKRSRVRLTPELINEIKIARKRGASYDGIAARYGVSVGSVRNALKRASEHTPAPSASASPAPPSAAPAEDDEPPSAAELRRWLSQQVRALQADADRLRADGDMPSLATTNRLLVGASTLLARVTPDHDPDAGGVLVPRAEMDDLGREVARRLHAFVDILTGEGSHT